MIRAWTDFHQPFYAIHTPISRDSQGGKKARIFYPESDLKSAILRRIFDAHFLVTNQGFPRIIKHGEQGYEKERMAEVCLVVSGFGTWLQGIRHPYRGR